MPIPLAAASLPLLFGGAVHAVLAGQRRDRHDPLAFFDLEHDHALRAPALDADALDRHADDHAGVGHEHDLIACAGREHGDDRILPPRQVHVLDTLTAAAGDAVVVSRAAHAIALLGDAEDEFLARRELGKLLFGDGALGRIALTFFGLGPRPRRFPRHCGGVASPGADRRRASANRLRYGAGSTARSPHRRRRA